MGHSIGDGIIVAALAAAFVAYLYFRYRLRRSRLEVIHAERLAAMDKGIPLPELPIDPPPGSKRTDPRELLIHGVVWSTLAAGSMVMLYLALPEALHDFWVAPLPLALMGVGLVLAHLFTRDAEHDAE